MKDALLSFSMLLKTEILIVTATKFGLKLKVVSRPTWLGKGWGGTVLARQPPLTIPDFGPLSN